MSEIEEKLEEVKHTVDKRRLGAHFSPTDVRDYRIAKVAKAIEFPAEFELNLCAVKNQGSVGSCVGHSLAETIEYHNKEQEKTDKKMSIGFIYGNRKNSLHKQEGMIVREALSAVCKYGDVCYEDFPYNKEVPEIINLFEKNFDKLKDKAYPNRFSTYFRLFSDSEIKQALMNHGPVIFAMNWYRDMKVDPKTGIISTAENKKDVEGGHCMVIYGWNENGWKIRNSWGTTWGIKGNAILPYDISRSETWGVTDEVIGENSDVVKPIFNTTFLKFLAKIINWFANLFKKSQN